MQFFARALQKKFCRKQSQKIHSRLKLSRGEFVWDEEMKYNKKTDFIFTFLKMQSNHDLTVIIILTAT